MLSSLVRNWWMMVTRGALAVVFGLVLLVSSRVTIDRLLLFFGSYAIIDGIWTLVAARRASPSLFRMWPIVLGGAVSVVIGALCIGWPFLPPRIVQLIVGWGFIVGGLEVIAALLTPRTTASHWLLGSGGVWTLFLALMVMALPHGDTDVVVRTLGVYAIVFGMLTILVASLFRHDARGSSVALS